MTVTFIHMSDIASAFVRQRRSLIIVSFILCVILVFGIDGNLAMTGCFDREYFDFVI